MARYRLRLLGSSAIVGDTGPIGGRVSHRHRLALLALLANAPDHTLGRDKIIALLWPDSSTDRARHLLSVAIHEIRKALDPEVLVTSGDDLRLDPSVLAADVIEFRAALAEGNPETAVAVYSGPFLDGFHLGDNLEFDEWADGMRAELAREYGKALERLAVEAETHGDPASAAGWWTRLAREEPYSGWIVARAIAAMSAAGDRGGALRYAKEHDAFMRKELGTGADAEVAELADRLRAESAHPGAFEPAAWPAPLREGAAVSAGDETPAPMAVVAARPTRRFPRAVLTSASFAALLLIAGGGTPSNLLPLQRDLVRVAVLENETDDPALDPVGRLARDWILKELGATGAVRVASEERRPEAGLTVAGAFHRQGDQLVFRARVEDAGSGETLRAITRVTADPRSPTGGAEELGQRVAGSLATVVDPRLASWAHAASQPPSPRAYREFVRGIDEFLRFNMGEAIAAFDRAAEEDPAFTAPRLWVIFAYQRQWGRAWQDSVAHSLEGMRDDMAPWDRAMLEYYLARSRGDLQGALRAARRVVEIVPDSEWRYLLAQAALDVNRPREAVQVLESTDLESGWLKGWDLLGMLANCLHLLGEYEREQEVGRLERARFPEDHFVNPEGVPMTADGRWNWATTLAGEAMEMRAHGDIQGAQRNFARAFAIYDSLPSLKRNNGFIYGMMLYEGGRWEEAEAVFANVQPSTGMGPVDVNLEGYRALVAARLGRVEEARAAAAMMFDLPDRMAAAGGRPGYYATWGTIYSARIHAVLGEPEEAVALLRGLFVEGLEWSYLMNQIHNEIDYQELKGHPLFEELIRPKG